MFSFCIDICTYLWNLQKLVNSAPLRLIAQLREQYTWLFSFFLLTFKNEFIQGSPISPAWVSDRVIWFHPGATSSCCQQLRWKAVYCLATEPPDWLYQFLLLSLVSFKKVSIRLIEIGEIYNKYHQYWTI